MDVRERGVVWFALRPRPRASLRARACVIAVFVRSLPRPHAFTHHARARARECGNAPARIGPRTDPEQALARDSERARVNVGHFRYPNRPRTLAARSTLPRLRVCARRGF